MGIDESTTFREHERDADLKKIAKLAAAEILAIAGAAAAQLSDTAAAAARTLAETTRVDLEYIKKDLQEIKDRLDSKFVTAEAFDPIRRLVYGQVALMLGAIMLGLLTLVLRK